MFGIKKDPENTKKSFILISSARSELPVAFKLDEFDGRLSLIIDDENRLFDVVGFGRFDRLLREAVGKRKFRNLSAVLSIDKEKFETNEFNDDILFLPLNR